MKKVLAFSQTKERQYSWRSICKAAVGIAALSVLGIAVDQRAFAQNEPALKTGENLLSIKSGNQARQYLLYIPAGFDGKKPLPLVLLFHGAGGNPKAIIEFTGLSNVADKKKFIIAAPEGMYRVGGRNAWNVLLNAQGVNDVEFVKDLINEISSRLNIDKKRIYSAGFSAGARMTVRLACAIPNEIAAIGVVTNLLYFESCANIRPLPVIAFHGTADLIGIPMKDVEGSVAKWAEHNSCNKIPSARKISEDVIQNKYSECKGTSEVIFYHINKGGHVWPDCPTAERLVKAGLVKAEEINKDINASNLIWSFFEAHSLP